MPALNVDENIVGGMELLKTAKHAHITMMANDDASFLMVFSLRRQDSEPQLPPVRSAFAI